MSFKLGSFDTNTIPGLKAILSEWPAITPDVDSVELPASDGSMYYRSRIKSSVWVFDLELTANSFEELMSAADTISTALNPTLHGGSQDFTPDPFPGWTWQGILTDSVAWKRDKIIWFSPSGACRMSGSAQISTLNPYGYHSDTPVVLTAPGTLHLASVAGSNASFIPEIVIRGTLNTNNTVNIGGTTVTGPLTSSQEMVLNFENLDFYIRDLSTHTKIRSVADRITAFSKPIGVRILDIPVSVTGGSFIKATGIAHSRRL